MRGLESEIMDLLGFFRYIWETLQGIMSAKLLAIMECVPDAVLRLGQNLKVEVFGDDGDREVQMYDMCLCFDNPSIISNYANSYRLWYYFQFSERRSSDLRNRFFDVVRALGPREMWLMDEMLSDCFDLYEDDIETILKKMTAEKEPWEFTNRHFEEFDLRNLLQMDPYEDDNYPHGSFYHDDFSDLFKEVEDIENRENVHILGLTEFTPDHIRVLNDDGIVSNLRIR